MASLSAFTIIVITINRIPLRPDRDERANLLNDFDSADGLCSGAGWQLHSDEAHEPRGRRGIAHRAARFGSRSAVWVQSSDWRGSCAFTRHTFDLALAEEFHRHNRGSNRRNLYRRTCHWHRAYA